MRPRDKNDDRDVIVEVRAGTGGDEAGLFAAELMRMYLRYAERRGWKHEIMNTNETDLKGIKEVTFEVRGKGAYSRLKWESGVHRVQRVPVTEAGGRIHTSTATVVVLPEAEEVDVSVDPNDIQIDVYRSGGHGGQSVNTTDSRRPDHPQADRPGRDLPGRALAAQEQGPRDGRPARPPLRARAPARAGRVEPDAAHPRSAPASAPRRSEPTTSRRTASPITASAPPSTTCPR